MPDLGDVQRLVSERLPELVIRHGEKGLSVFADTREIAWQRPLSKKDMKALGDRAPAGEILAVHVDSVAAKNAWILAAPTTCFDSAHFKNYPAVLVDLLNCDLEVVFELLGQHLD